MAQRGLFFKKTEPVRRKREWPESGEVSQERIAHRAYEKFLARGGQHGEDQRDWLEAEQELKAEASKN